MKIPRCHSPGGDGSPEFEIHVFCDASEEAFAAVAYLRTMTAEGRASSNIIMAKTRVAPKKTISVAKLELPATLLGARIAQTLGKELSFTIRPIARAHEIGYERQPRTTSRSSVPGLESFRRSRKRASGGLYLFRGGLC